jgi:hypothetical protein
MRYMLNISDEEKQALLNQHSRPYDGYQTLRFPEPDNRIHTYDPAGDKGGITVNNRGEVKSYTNVGINESMGEKCECGGNMYEGECMECGYKSGGPVAEPHYGSFDYVENEMCECGGMYNEGVCNECGGSYMNEDIAEPYSEIDFSNYDFDSKGPEQFKDENMDNNEELFPSYDSDGNFLGMGKSSGDMELDGEEMYPEEKPAYEFDSPGPYGSTNTFEGIENPEKVKESIKESLNWFKRFSKFN